MTIGKGAWLKLLDKKVLSNKINIDFLNIGGKNRSVKVKNILNPIRTQKTPCTVLILD